MEQTPNNTQIARDIKNKFKINTELDRVRKNVSRWREKWKVEAKQIPIKRLFFDIETSYYILKLRVWQLKNYKTYFDPDDIEVEKQIICISYKWQYEDEVHNLDWRMGEKEMLKKFIKIIGDADELIAFNGDNFDIKFLRTRCIKHGILMFPTYRTLDPLKKARSHFLFASNKLDYLGEFLNTGRKTEHEGFDMWKKIVEEGDEEALNKMIEYCNNDVILLEDTFFVISPFINHNNNFAILTGGEKWHCPECASEDVEMYRTYSTPMGIIRRKMKCNACRKQYRISNRTYMHMLEDQFKTNGSKI